MATRQSVENLIEKANLYVDEAKNQLNITNRNGYEIGNDYIEAQQKLTEVEQDIEKLMASANHQQREQLHRLHLMVANYLNDMVLDRIDINELH